MIESTVGNAVHIQTLYFYAGLLVVLGRYCIIINSYCIFTAKDNNIDLFCLIIISNNGSGCQIVVIITSLCWRWGLYTMELLELMGSVSYGLKMIKLGEKKATSKEWEISSLIAKEIIWCESYLTLKGEQLVK